MIPEETSSTSKETPKSKSALLDKYREEEKNKKDPLNPDNLENIDQLPEPSGWRILVLPFTPKDKTKGGILIAQETLDKLRIATNCGYVLKMGPLCYSEKKFTSGPWCKKEIG